MGINKEENIYQLGYFLNLNIKIKNLIFQNISGELSKPYIYDIFVDKYKLHSYYQLFLYWIYQLLKAKKLKAYLKVQIK